MFLGAVIIEDHLFVLDDKQWRINPTSLLREVLRVESFDPDLYPFGVSVKVNAKASSISGVAQVIKYWGGLSNIEEDASDP